MHRNTQDESPRYRDRDLNLIDRIVKDVQSWIRHGSEQWSQRSRNQQQAGYTGASDDAYAYRYYGAESEPADHSQHRGKGPRGYVRPDERVYEDACERLTAHGAVDASAIDVDVTNGIVRLSGQVDTRATKRLAEALVEGVSGVRDVENCLTLAHSNDAGRTTAG